MKKNNNIKEIPLRKEDVRDIIENKNNSPLIIIIII